MNKKIHASLAFLFLLASLAFLISKAPIHTRAVNAFEFFKKGERVLVLAPHPDDESIGCAGIIQEALKKGAEVKVVYLTNGDQNEFAFMVYGKRPIVIKWDFIHMGNIRRLEAIKAMKSLGLPEKNLTFLGYPDGGTFAIFSKYWKTNKPYMSLLTRIWKVPYKNNPSYGEPYLAHNILEDLENVLLDFKPNKIFVSHPADTNVDHRGYYLFLQIALLDLKDKMPKPEVYPYLIHASGWPLPRHYHPTLRLEAPKQFAASGISWLAFNLSPEQIDKKYKAILSYPSQTNSSAFYLLSFARSNELFGEYPPIYLRNQTSVKEQAIQFFQGLKCPSSFGQECGLVNYALVDNALLIRIEKAKNLHRTFGLSVYLFGYSKKTPFAQMPKLRIITKADKIRVFDERKRIDSALVSVTLSSEALILKVPLEVLGEPEFILSSVMARKTILSASETGFRKIYIENKNGERL